MQSVTSVLGLVTSGEGKKSVAKAPVVRDLSGKMIAKHYNEIFVKHGPCLVLLCL